MNLYNNTNIKNIRLFPRNEGKLKSYKSCRDIRAWSHDSQRRDSYLKEWMKGDMPVSVIPSCVLVYLLRTMTCKKHLRPTPQCHPDCKSKMVLESICNSCEAMKQCLKNEKCFDKFFDDEELETSHWPCDRCLGALKSIKMFWRIILEKIFQIRLPKHEEPERDICAAGDNIHSVAKGWQNQLVHEATIVNNFKTSVRLSPDCINDLELSNCLKKVATFHKLNTLKQDTSTRNEGKSSCVCAKKKPTAIKCTNTDSLSKIAIASSSTSPQYSRVNRQTSARVKTVNVSCECYNFEDITNEINEYKLNLSLLQNKLHGQNKELEILRKETKTLKHELQHLYKCSSWRSLFTSANPFEDKNKDGDNEMIKPFEEEICPRFTAKGIDSEMVITMKNCKNETYRHISLLQVVHKSNTPVLVQTDSDVEQCCDTRNGDPIKLLTKVKHNFGEMVRREIYVATEKRKETEINSAYFKAKSPKQAHQKPACIIPLESCCSASKSTDISDFVNSLDISECPSI